MGARREASARDSHAACRSAGLVVANPPYGERIGGFSAASALWRSSAPAARAIPGWQAAILTAIRRSPAISAFSPSAPIGYSTAPSNAGCLRFDLTGDSARPSPSERRAKWSARPGAQMFANALRKNLDRLEPWAAKEGIECYRLYDADHAEYAFAMTSTDATAPRVRAGVRAAGRPSIRRARGAPRGSVTVLPYALAVPLERVHSRVRKSQKGPSNTTSIRPARARRGVTPIRGSGRFRGSGRLRGRCRAREVPRGRLESG